MSPAELPVGYSLLPLWFRARGFTSYEFNRVYDAANRWCPDLSFWKITSLEDCNVAPPSRTISYEELRRLEAGRAISFAEFASPFLSRTKIDGWLAARAEVVSGDGSGLSLISNELSLRPSA
jgi:hypothetical protein